MSQIAVRNSILMRGFTYVRVAAGCLISTGLLRSIRTLCAMSGDSDALLSILATAAAFGASENFFRSLTTLKSFHSPKETPQSTTHHVPLITVVSRN